MKALLRCLLLTAVLFPGFACAAAASVPLIDPAPIAIPSGLTPQSVVKAIKLAFAERKWEVSGEAAEYVEGTLHLRQHLLKILVRHSGQKVTIQYIDSAELGFEMRGNTRYIHPKYKNWTDNLLLDINKYFVLMQASP